MKTTVHMLCVLTILVVSFSLATAHDGGILVANRVANPPIIDGSGEDPVWNVGFHYPFAYNQLNERDQVWTDLEDLSASFRLIHVDNVLYGIVYRQDDITNTSNSPPWENDSVEIFFDVAHDQKSLIQRRTIVGQGWDNTIGGIEPIAVWNEDGTILEFAIDLSGLGVELKPGLIIGFDMAINDADEGMRETMLFPFPGSDKSSQTAYAFGHLSFQ